VSSNLALAILLFDVCRTCLARNCFLAFRMIEKTETFLNRHFLLGNHISCRGRQGISRPPSNLAASATLLLFPLETEAPHPLTSCFCLPDSPHFASQLLHSGVRRNEKSGYLLVVHFIPWKKSSHVPTPSVVDMCKTLPPTVGELGTCKNQYFHHTFGAKVCGTKLLGFFRCRSCSTAQSILEDTASG
jgi:hypothetical protein